MSIVNRLVPTETDRAYAAAILDGEGTIHLGGKTPSQIRLQVAVINTHHGLLEWLEARWGGVIYGLRGNDHKGWAPCWQWALNTAADKHAFLSALLPYMIIKRPACEIALEFLKLGTSRRRTSPAVAARKHELFIAIRSLKHPEFIDDVIDDGQMKIEVLDSYGA